MTDSDTPTGDPTSAAIDPIDGGVTAAAGFRTAGTACGIKPSGLDLALVVADQPAKAAGVFTTNLASAAPVRISRDHLQRSNGIAQAIVVNSGCANACTGDQGVAVARSMAVETAKLVGCPDEQVLVASTGVIGVALDEARVKAGIVTSFQELSREGHVAAARAIMTTDPWPKEAAVRVSTAAGVFHVGGMVKGAGMIEPHMATMLAFLTTDARVEPAVLQGVLRETVDETFNAITVDGERSTNDSVFVLASGASGVEITPILRSVFSKALWTVCLNLAQGIIRGGEGATKLVAVRVTGARSRAHARLAARALANSPLVKTALHGGDPNWGRLVAVAGRSGAAFDLAHCVVKMGAATLFSHETAFVDRETQAAEHLRGRDVEVEVDLGTGGNHSATIWTCDLSAEYVRVNADYRT